MPRKKRKRSYQQFALPSENFQKPATEEIKSAVGDLFNKVFTFQRADDWKVPLLILPKTEPWEVESLQQMKCELNEIKDSLSDFDIDLWHSHTTRTNPAGEVISHVQATIHPELLTQAWCKFHEILCKFDIVPRDVEDFNSVHLCEAPGAFVASLNHFMKTRDKPYQWTWLGNTLNPYNEGCSLSTMIADDRLILNTPQNWYFGPSDLGDITDIDVYEGLCEKARNIGLIQLVTADGSVDCQYNPAEQEAIVSRLHFCELTTALSVLCDGGHFVLKMFTMFESQTVCLMYILNCLFEEVHVFKPATSKSGNSEVYVICKNFHNRQDFDSLLPSLRQFFEAPKCPQDQPLFTPDAIPQSYKDQHVSCCQKFKDYQQKTISDNVSLFKHPSPSKDKYLHGLRRYCAEFYVENCCLKTLPLHERIVYKPGPRPHFGFNKRLEGSFHERQSDKSLTWQQKVSLWEPSEKCDEWTWFENPIIHPLEVSSWLPTTGQPIGRVLNSKFCSTHTLQKYNETLDSCQVLKQNQPAASLYTVVPSIEEIIHIVNREEHMSLVDSSNIHTVDVTQGNYFYSGEIKTKLTLVTVISDKLKVLQENQCLCVTLHDLLTRYTVSLLYILSRCFSKLTLRPVSQSGCQVSAIFQGFRYCPPDVLTYMDSVCSLCAKKDVQQLIPMSELYGAKQFISYVTNVNERVLQRRVDHLMKLEKNYLNS